MSRRGPPKKGGFSEGTGYGGADGTDKQKLLQGRKKAAKAESKHDKESLKFLRSTHTKLLKAIRKHNDDYIREFVEKDDDSKKLVRMLQEIFRNTAPTDWGPRQDLYTKALDVCETLSSNQTLGSLLILVIDDDEPSDHAKIEIEESDDETIVTSLSQFAELAECVQSSTKAEPDDVQFATRVIQVKSKVEQMAQQVKAQTKKNASILSVLTPSDIYKRELGPLRFDLCSSLEHHHYDAKGAKTAAAANSATSAARTLFKELTSYKTALPVEYGSSIFVRAIEDRLDTIRALILGPDETPYANGCFVFDISLPPSYPHVPPKVNFVNHGRQRFNPNLYNCGKVCLSLLGTWKGPSWVPGESTLLQVLVSIQSLILVPDPYFNEPGYESSRGTDYSTKRSDSYNQTIQRHTLNISMEPILKCIAQNKPTPYPEFDEVFRKHFFHKRHVIERQLTQWAASVTGPTLRGTETSIRGHLGTLAAMMDDGKSAKKRAPVVAYKVDSNGVIDLAESEGRSKRQRKQAPAGKPSSPNEVVSLLDEEDSKMPAVPTNNTTEASAAAGGDVVDLT